MIKLDDSGSGNAVSIPEQGTGKISVTFRGNNNRFVLTNRRRIGTLDVTFEGDGGLVSIDVMRIGSLRILVKKGGQIKVKRRTSIEGCYMLADEGRKVTIGEDCMISFNTQLRTSDAHGIYDIASGERINEARDIRLGDHVWLGQGALISKGAKIGANCVVGANAFVPGNSFPSCSMIAGVPARVLREGIIWDRRAAERITDAPEAMDPDFARWHALAMAGR